MEDSKRKAAATTRAARVEKSRAQFRTLIAANPNYFGNFPGAKFKAVTKLLSNTSYEQLTELGYNPRMRRLTATFDIKKSAGYGGDLCADGTREYVRFYVNRGSGWEDAGLVAAEHPRLLGSHVHGHARHGIVVPPGQTRLGARVARSEVDVLQIEIELTRRVLGGRDQGCGEE